MWGLNLIFILCLLMSTTAYAALSDYLQGIGNYFGFNEQIGDSTDEEIYTQKIPYEVSSVDEKFLSEAAKLTGVTLSELDSCQQRVVLKLKSDCNKINDEQLAKMAVHLLNCQSYVEGRPTYPCTDEMNIKQCTTNMDSDTWTSYHLMSNRARAVCYMIRQIQFRGLAEHTVNRLMEAARSQLSTLGEVVHNQETLKNLAETTYDALNEGHKILSNQQEDIQRAQFYGQLAIENNINRLVEEKRLILETHNDLIEMTQNVQEKLGHSLEQLESHSNENRLHHKELISDILKIHAKAQEIYKKIDESSNLLIKQNEDLNRHYMSTLKNLEEVNRTVHNLAALIDGTRLALEERLSWISTALGGTDLAVERLYLFLWHFTFMLLAMITCAFLAARTSTRLIVTILPPLNLVLGLYGEQNLDPFSLASTIGIFIFVQTILPTALSFKPAVKIAIPWNKEKFSPTKINTADNLQKTPASSKDFEFAESAASRDNETYQSIDSYLDYAKENHNFKDTLETLTPPLSRNGDYSLKSRSRSRSNTPVLINTGFRNLCHAKTRAGTACKISSLPGRDFCYRHQTGDSVFS